MTLAERLALPDVADISDVSTAAALNAPDPAYPVKHIDVPTSAARGYLLRTGEWGAIKLLSRATPTDTLPVEAVAAAIVAIDTLELTSNLETSKPDFHTAVSILLSGLQLAGVLSADSLAALMAMADQHLSWAEQMNLEIDGTVIGLARGGRN